MESGSRRAGHEAHVSGFHIGQRHQPGASHLGVILGGLGEPGAAEEHMVHGLALGDLGHALAAGHQIREHVAPEQARARHPTLARLAFIDVGTLPDRSFAAFVEWVPDLAGRHFQEVASQDLATLEERAKVEASEHTDRGGDGSPGTTVGGVY